MLLVAFIVFLAVFLVIVLIATSMGGRSAQHKQMMERLESLTMAAKRHPEDEGLNILREEMLGSMPLIDRWVQEMDLFPKLRQVLIQTDLRWTVSRLLMFVLLSAALTFALTYWRTRAWPFALLMSGLGGAAPVGFVFYKRRERFDRFEEKLPEALDMMVGAIRAGHSILSAIEMVAREMTPPISVEFRKCFDEQNFGLDLREAMLNLATRVPIHDTHIIVTAILIQKESGGNLAEILEKVAQIIRDRFRLKRQIRVYTAQGRLTGWILALLPVVLAALLYLINPEHMSKLWTHKVGLKLIYFATFMTTLGALIIRKIIRIQV